MTLAVPKSRIRGTIQFHDELSPDLWDGTQLRSRVRLHLLRAAMEFYRFLDVPGLRIVDVILTGSNAAFNYTPLSDLDVHILVDFSSSGCPSLAENLFTTKKALWTSLYGDVRVRGYPVELYVEDTAEPVQANGIFSLLRNEWIKEPTRTRPALDDRAVLRKTEALANEIEAVETSNDEDEVVRLLSRLRTMRAAGLMKAGEFSTENIAYKALRALGFLDRLYAARRRITSRELSLEGASARL